MFFLQRGNRQTIESLLWVYKVLSFKRLARNAHSSFPTVGPSLSLAISSSAAASLVPSSPSQPVFARSVRYLTKPNGFFSVLLRENQFAFFLLLFFLSRSPLPRSTAHQFSTLPSSLPLSLLLLALLSF